MKLKGEKEKYYIGEFPNKYILAKGDLIVVMTDLVNTAPERIYRCNIPLPPLPIQQKIAFILSAYDDLIENNLRRIELLEQSAL